MVFEHDYVNFPELTNTQINDFGFASPHKQITEDFRATVVRVHDGDTVTLRTTFRDFDFPLRLLDIDAPELNEGGKEAKEWLTQRILNQSVMVLIDSQNRVGKYGRLLGAILSGGMNVAEEEIHLGLAKPFGQKKEAEIEPADKVFSIRKWLP